MNTLKLQYFFDPLCGWCYASAPALAGLAAAYPDALELMPSGLFSEHGARAMSPEWVAHAWGNDQRIARLTGQHYSEAYHRDVLQGEDVRFDSGPANRALTAIRMLAPRLETHFLHEMQRQRYVEGLDTALPSVLGNIAAATGAESGIPLDAGQFSHRLMHDVLLEQATIERIAVTQRLMQRYGVAGIPQLLVRTGNSEQILHGAVLYRGEQALLAAVERAASSMAA
ncbi:MAG: DsbA family protein [Burkholderiales bacterium]|nr:DsbA family protein [Burkholderiales bacterium]